MYISNFPYKTSLRLSYLVQAIISKKNILISYFLCIFFDLHIVLCVEISHKYSEQIE